MAKDVVCAWLDGAGMPFDVAIVPAFGSGVDWRAVDPSRYSHVLFVCGPFYPLISSGAVRTVEARGREPLDDGARGCLEPADLLYERDSEDVARPDLAFGAPRAEVPVVGVRTAAVRDADRSERGEAANDLLRSLLVSRHVAVALLDTRLEGRVDGVSVSAPAIESLIRRLDLVVFVRLHGLVLALRNGVPALALDPVDGGGKILRQAIALGWPAALSTSGRQPIAGWPRRSRSVSGRGEDDGSATATDAARQVDALGVSFSSNGSPDQTPAPAWGDGRRRRGWVTPSARRSSRSGRRDAGRWMRRAA